ncbi:trigger factor [candidate division WS5 bacterium]|uniref:Trigger factor n=1 Tax=candidate division WS5 bacterium TaxID=2093353 RepID=A0A419DAE4_9BACT|nr:MAG: trigger factor [candidate division WS5 bacterium]
MQIKREDISKTKVKLVVELTEAEVKPHIEKVYKNLAKNLKIAGFRPGKAPQFVVEKEVGQDKFYAEVLDSILPEAYYSAITKEKLITVSRPDIKVTKYAPTGGLEFEAEVEMLPEFDLPDYKKIKVPRAEVKITAKDIENSIKELQERYAEFKEVSRKAKKDDRAEISFEGTQKGAPVQGVKGEKYPITIGSGAFIPGFEENLVGMSKGEEKTFDVAFPKDYHEEKLRGEKVTFKVKMITISEKTIPEVSDDFAKKFGIFKNVDELKKGVEKNLREVKEMEEKRRLEEKIMTLIAEKVKLELPEALIHQEVHRMWHDAEANLAQSGITMDRYIEMTKKTREELEKEMKPDAEKRVKMGLILSKISENEKIEVTDKEIDAEKAMILAGAPQNADELKKKLDEHEAQHQIKNSIISRKTMEKLFEYCVK